MLRNRTGGTTTNNGFTAAYGSQDFGYGNGSAKSSYTASGGYGNTAGNSYGNTAGYGSNGGISYGNQSLPKKSGVVKKNKPAQGNYSLLQILPWILTLLFFVTTMFCRYQTNSAQSRYSQLKTDFDIEQQSLKQLKRDHSDLDRNYSKKRQTTSYLETKASELESEVEMLLSTIREKDLELEQQGQSVSSSNPKMEGEINMLKKRDEALRKRIGILVEKIELESYREAMER